MDREKEGDEDGNATWDMEGVEEAYCDGHKGFIDFVIILRLKASIL